MKTITRIFAPIIRLFSRHNNAQVKYSFPNKKDESDLERWEPLTAQYPPEFMDKMIKVETLLVEACALMRQGMEELHQPNKTRIMEFMHEMQRFMSTRLFMRLGEYCRDCDGYSYLEDLSEEKFMKIRSAGEKTYKEFLSVKEEYYKRVGENTEYYKRKSRRLHHIKTVLP